MHQSMMIRCQSSVDILTTCALYNYYSDRVSGWAKWLKWNKRPKWGGQDGQGGQIGPDGPNRLHLFVSFKFETNELTEKMISSPPDFKILTQLLTTKAG